jgi:hypothetical protein
LTFPGQGKAFVLDDEPRGGFQAFALVLSRQPLPAFADWSKKRGAAAWRHQAAGKGVYGHDHEGLYQLLPGGRVVREKMNGPDGRALQLLVDSLRRGSGVERVQVLAFPVKAKDE